MEEKLCEIIVEICDDDVVFDDYDLDLFEEDLFDSLAMVELLVAIDEKFGITISPTEYDKSQLSTVRKIAKIIRDKGRIE